MIVRSTSVSSPDVTSWTRLPVAPSSSRTRRLIRRNTAFTGCARIAMTLSCRSRVR